MASSAAPGEGAGRTALSAKNKTIVTVNFTSFQTNQTLQCSVNKTTNAFSLVKNNDCNGWCRK